MPTFFGYILGNSIWAQCLNYPFYPGTGEVAVFASAFVGAGVGFLCFNAYPAQTFMGDTGAMAIGGSMAVMSVELKQEALFIILGGLFVVEALSSQIQDKIGIRWLGRIRHPVSISGGNGDRLKRRRGPRCHALAQSQQETRSWSEPAFLPAGWPAL